MKSVSSLFARMRERRDEKELQKARREGFAAGQRRAEIVARVEWASAALALAEKTGDVELIRKCCETAVAANTALHKMNAVAIAEIGHALDLVKNQSEEKSRLSKLGFGF